MATTFGNSLIQAFGTDPVTAITSASNARVTVIGLSLTNLTASVILATILIEDNNTNDSAHYIKEIPVPPNQSLRVINGGEKLIIGTNTSIILSASQPASLDLVMSYVTIT
jgi:hypothetical protein